MSDAKVEFETLDFDPAPPGAEARFGFKCPRHPTNRCEGLLLRRGAPGSSRPSWIWDGNPVSPTFLPSINCGGCPGKWHGYIRKGRCVTTDGVDEPEPATREA
jgi:hypothetical protein